MTEACKGWTFFAAHGGERRRAGQRPNPAPVHRTVRSLWLPARSDGAGLRSCGKLGGPRVSAHGPGAGNRPGGSGGVEHARHSAPARPDDAHPLEIASCGLPLPGNEIRIVDELGYEVGERHEKAGWSSAGLRQPRAISAMKPSRANFSTGGWLERRPRLHGRRRGSHNRPDQGHRRPRQAGTLSSGNRRSHCQIPGIRKGCVAVFGTADRASGTERVVVWPRRARAILPHAQHFRSARKRLRPASAGTPPDEIVLRRRARCRRRRAAEIRRSSAKELYETGRIGYAATGGMVARILRLSLAGAGASLAGRWLPGVRHSRSLVVDRDTAGLCNGMVCGNAATPAQMALARGARHRPRHACRCGVRLQRRTWSACRAETPCSCSIIRATWTWWFSPRFCRASLLT